MDALNARIAADQRAARLERYEQATGPGGLHVGHVAAKWAVSDWYDL